MASLVKATSIILSNQQPFTHVANNDLRLSQQQLRRFKRRSGVPAKKVLQIDVEGKRSRVAISPKSVLEFRPTEETRQQDLNLQTGEPAGTAAREEKGGSEELPFQWKSNWYAVQVLKHMDPKRPHPVSVLGEPYVLWKDGQGQWRCFMDECPHRLVPLSEGRIDEQGRLQCSYHGWTFSGDGKCQVMPQADLATSEGKALSSPRACAKAVPAKVFQGILFIWPDPQGWELANATPPPVVPEYDEEQAKGLAITASVRDLAYGYEMLAENIVDVSHLPFAHHGIGGLKRDQGAPLKLRLAADKGKKGFEGVSEDDVMPATQLLRTKFFAPSMYTYRREREVDGKRVFSFVNIYLTPTTPGHSRAVLHQGFPSVGRWKLGPLKITIPEFLGHLIEQDIWDSDGVFLHGQERTMQRLQVDSRDWNKAFYMPYSADNFVVAYRRWLANHAGGGVQYAPGVNPTLPTAFAPREEIMNRLDGHTRNCSTCSSALQNFEKWRTITAGASIPLLLGAAAVRGDIIPLSVSLLLLGLMSAGSSYLLHGLIQQFIYKGWDHASR